MAWTVRAFAIGVLVKSEIFRKERLVERAGVGADSGDQGIGFEMPIIGAER